jgi:hypothetical protein
VAHITPTSDVGNWRMPPPRSIVPAEMWFGHHVPEGVTAISMQRSYIDEQLLVRWRVKGDPVIHEMPFEQTDEGVMAALVAMKLTC